MQLTVKRIVDEAPVDVAVFDIDEQTVYVKELMGADKITAKVNLSAVPDLLIGDYIVYNSINYTINRSPHVTRKSATNLEYTIEFEGPVYDMYRKLLIDEGVAQFSYSGTPDDLLNLIVSNLQELDPTWSKGVVSASTEVKNFTFDGESCRVALQRVADEFGLEFKLVGKAISLTANIGTTQAYTFQYGRGNGLYELTRQTRDEHFATRWYGYGAKKNLPASYRSGMGQLSFDDNPVSVNDDVYGVIDGIKVFDTIYPRFEGVVDSTPDEFSVIDANIDFDLNGQFLNGAKIVFKTGDLGGNEFDIKFYDHATKKVTFGTISEQSGYTLPNATVKAAVGDEFTFVGIEMPTEYIDAAEAELEAALTEYANANSNPKVSYSLTIDEKYIRTHSLQGLLQPGDRVHVIDTDLSVDDDLKIQSVQWPLVNEADVTVLINETRPFTLQERLFKELRDIEVDLRDIDYNANYSYQLANEIRNAAILTQFEKTYVGERAILSGAFVVGNPTAGQNAGVSGEGNADSDIRFWAGSDYDNRDTAPYRVEHDGSVYMSQAFIDNGCIIGAFSIASNNLSAVSGGIVQATVSTNGIGSAAANLELFTAPTPVTKGSIYGLVYVDGASFATLPSVKAGVVGVVDEDMTNQHLVDQNGYGVGVYGGFFSSIKNIGGQYKAMRRETTGVVNVTTSDRVIVVSGTVSDVNLPERPDHGFGLTIMQVKALTAVDLNRGGSVDDIFIVNDNTAYTTYAFDEDQTMELCFHGPTRRWYAYVV